MKTISILLVVLVVACTAQPSTSIEMSASTTCVSDPITGHPIGSVSRCPPPDPYAAEKQATIVSAETNNPSGTVDVNDISCFSMQSGFRVCNVTVSFFDSPIISWVCTYSTDTPPIENCNPRAPD